MGEFKSMDISGKTENTDDVLKIIGQDGTVTEVERPFDAIQLVILARYSRYTAIKEFVCAGVFDRETARELLSGPLAPGDDSTIYDDSGLIDLGPNDAAKMIQFGRLEE